MADVIRKSGRRFIRRFEKSLSWPQVKVLNAIERCRTAALGGHLDQRDRCGHQVISYNSCRNRHCPKCQTNARDKWLAARQQELLPVDLCVLPRYVVFDLRSRDVGGHFRKNTT